MARLLTVEDIEYFYQGTEMHPFKLYGDLIDVMKTAGTISTSVTGIWNRVYGALVWAQMNQEANAFAALPKSTWPRSGWRVKTGFAVTNEANIGISETGTLPSAAYPDINLVYSAPRIEAQVFDVTDVIEALAGMSEDDIWGSANQVRTEMGIEFAKNINKQLLHDVQETPGSWATPLETLDRVVAKDSEGGKTSGWHDVYGLDRSDANYAWANSYVNDNGGTDRDLTDELIRNTIAGARARGGNPNLIITGYDTYAKLSGLYTVFVRYAPMSETKVTVGVGGISTEPGIAAGIKVATLYDIPIIQSVDAPKDTISRMFFLDVTDTEGYGLPRLGIAVLRPVEYFESRDYVLLNKFVIRGLYRFVGQTIGRFLYGQGKLMDLQ